MQADAAFHTRHRRSALRATLPRPLTDNERIRSIRIVHVQDGHPRVCPSRWEAHVVVEGPAQAAPAKRARPRAIGLDIGARRVFTNDTGISAPPVPTPSTARAQARALSRKRRGSNARRRARARLRQHAARHALRRRQHVTKHATRIAKEHAVGTSSRTSITRRCAPAAEGTSAD